MSNVRSATCNVHRAMCIVHRAHVDWVKRRVRRRVGLAETVFDGSKGPKRTGGRKERNELSGRGNSATHGDPHGAQRTLYGHSARLPRHDVPDDRAVAAGVPSYS